MPFIKRLLYYLLLILIIIVMLVICSMWREYGKILSVITMFGILISHYVFGIIFLKTKLIFKFTLPIVTFFVSFGTVWLIEQTTNLLDIYPFMMFFPYVIVWEIAYQIIILNADIIKPPLDEK